MSKPPSQRMEIPVSTWLWAVSQPHWPHADTLRAAEAVILPGDERAPPPAPSGRRLPLPTAAEQSRRPGVAGRQKRSPGKGERGKRKENRSQGHRNQRVGREGRPERPREAEKEGASQRPEHTGRRQRLRVAQLEPLGCAAWGPHI